jgi:hypothetical protein
MQHERKAAHAGIRREKQPGKNLGRFSLSGIKLLVDIIKK